MENTGFKLGQYVINNVGWTNVNNILAADGSFAASTPVTGQASEFTVGGFLLNVPAGALISGIELQFTGYRGIDTLPGTSLEVWAYDNTNDNNAYYQMLPVFTDFNTSVGTFVLGSQTYTFNTIIDAIQANNLKFKIVVNGEVYLDSVEVRCFYQPAVENIIITPETCSPLLQAQPFYLEIPIGSADTTCIVNQFVTISGLPITDIDIPNGYPAVLDQGKSNEENIIITAVEFLSGDRRQLTISRGWTDRDPVGQETFLRKPHGAGAELTLSNNIEFYDLFLRKCHIGTLVSAPITVKDESTPIATYLRDLNFVGSGVQATAVSHVGSGGGQDVTVTISGNNTVPPTVNGSSSGTSGNNLVNTLTYNTHAITGTNRATLVSVSMSSAASLSSVTLGGDAMTFLGANNNGGVRVEDWVLVNPALGVQPIVITVAASATSYISSTQVTWNGADQTTPFVLGTTNDGSDNDSEGTATTTVNNSIIVHTLATALPTITYSAGTGENLVATSLTGQVQSGIQTLDVGTPSTQTSTINLSQNATWANILVSLAPVPVIGDKLVAVTSADTTPGYLQSKVQAGANITLSVINPGGNEKLQITSSGGGGGGLTGVQNVGGGDGEIFRDITGGDTVNLKTLESSDGSVTITNNTDTIDLTVSGGSGTGGGGGTKLQISTNNVTVQNTTTETDLLSVTIPANLLSTNNGIKALINIPTFQNTGGDSITLRMKYGTTTVASLTMLPAGGGNNSGTVSATFLAAGATNSQEGNLSYITTRDVLTSSQVMVTDNGTATEDSTTSLTFKITAEWNAASMSDIVVVDNSIVEKIVGGSGLLFKNSIFTKSGSSQTVTHNLGTTPQRILTQGVGTAFNSSGCYDSSGQNSVGSRQGGGSSTSGTGALIALDNAVSAEIGVIFNVTSTTFDVSWSGTSIPGSFLYSVEG